MIGDERHSEIYHVMCCHLLSDTCGWLSLLFRGVWSMSAFLVALAIGLSWGLIVWIICWFLSGDK